MEHYVVFVLFCFVRCLLCFGKFLMRKNEMQSPVLGDDRRKSSWCYMLCYFYVFFRIFIFLVIRKMPMFLNSCIRWWKWCSMFSILYACRRICYVAGCRSSEYIWTLKMYINIRSLHDSQCPCLFISHINTICIQANIFVKYKSFLFSSRVQCTWYMVCAFFFSFGFLFHLYFRLFTSTQFSTSKKV